MFIPVTGATYYLFTFPSSYHLISTTNNKTEITNGIHVFLTQAVNSNLQPVKSVNDICILPARITDAYSLLRFIHLPLVDLLI